MDTHQPTPHHEDPPGDWTDEADRFAREERLRQAAQHRRSERWRRQRSMDEAGLVELLRSATGTKVTLHLPAGSIAGQLESVGAHLATLILTDGRRWVAVDAVEAVEMSAPPIADAPSTTGTTMLEIIEEMRADTAEVRIGLRSGSVMRGTIVACGASVVTRDNDSGAHVAVDPEAIAWVAV
jgi:hypothetical protein